MLSNKQINIYLILSKKINDSNIILKIMNLVKYIEEKETFYYYNNLWLNISKSFFNSINKSPLGDPLPYSFIVDSKKYVYEGDRNLSYFNKTGISYQSRELLLETIKNDEINWSGDINKYIDNLSENSKYWRMYNDKLYSTLSKLILASTKDINNVGRNIYIEE